MHSLFLITLFVTIGNQYMHANDLKYPRNNAEMDASSIELPSSGRISFQRIKEEGPDLEGLKMIDRVMSNHVKTISSSFPSKSSKTILSISNSIRAAIEKPLLYGQTNITYFTLEFSEKTFVLSRRDDLASDIQAYDVLSPTAWWNYMPQEQRVSVDTVPSKLRHPLEVFLSSAVARIANIKDPYTKPDSDISASRSSFGDWKENGGWKIPFSITNISETITERIYIKKCEFNCTTNALSSLVLPLVTVQDNRFDPPLFYSAKGTIPNDSFVLRISKDPKFREQNDALLLRLNN